MRVSLRPLWLQLLAATAVIALAAGGFLLREILRQWPLKSGEIAQTREGAWEIDRRNKIERGELPLFPAVSPERPPLHLPSLELRRLEALKRRIEERHGIEVRVFDPSPLWEAAGIHASPYPPTSLLQHLRSLSLWLEAYPPGYLERSGLKTIYLFKGWEADTVQTSGFLIDKASIGIEAAPSILHHELFHIADMNDGGMENDNADWVRAKYGEDAAPVTQPAGLEAIAHQQYGAERPIGYASAYGKYGGTDEDQATVAEGMLMAPGTMKKWSADDPALRNAMEEIRQFFARLSDGRMDSQFWEDLASLKAPSQSYWELR